MKHRRLILVGGTVAWASVHLVRRNRRPSRRVRLSRPHRAAVAIPAYLVAISGPWFAWDAGGFAGQIWGLFGVIWDQIKDNVLWVVNAAAQILTDVINAVEAAATWGINAAQQGLKDIGDLAHKGLDAVAGVIADTYDMLTATFDIVRQQIKDLFEGFWHDFKDIMGDLLPDFIGDFFGDAWDIIQALVGIGMDGVRFLINLIDDPINFLWDLLKDVVSDAIDSAFGVFGEVWDLLGKIWHILEWLASHAAELTEEVLSKLWDIIWWVITHLDDFTIEAFESILDLSPESFAEKMIAAMDANRAGIEEKFTSWL